MADDKKPPAQDKGAPADDKRAPPRSAAKADPEPETAPDTRPNLTQQQVEGFLHNQLCQKGVPSEQAALEAKARAALMVR